MRGALKINASNRSKNPPCPGRIREESFNPESLLRRLSRRSPAGPADPATTTTGRAAASGTGKDAPANAQAMSSPARDPANPDQNPSQVLFGLMRGARGRFPNFL